MRKLTFIVGFVSSFPVVWRPQNKEKEEGKVCIAVAATEITEKTPKLQSRSRRLFISALQQPKIEVDKLGAAAVSGRQWWWWHHGWDRLLGGEMRMSQPLHTANRGLRRSTAEIGPGLWKKWDREFRRRALGRENADVVAGSDVRFSWWRLWPRPELFKRLGCLSTYSFGW